LSRRSRRFDAACVRVAVRHPHAVKVHTRGRMMSAFYEDPTLFADDQFHASDKGHAVFAEEAATAFDAAYRIAQGRRSSAA
jgi:hypothetical protein